RVASVKPQSEKSEHWQNPHQVRKRLGHKTGDRHNHQRQKVKDDKRPSASPAGGQGTERKQPNPPSGSLNDSIGEFRPGGSNVFGGPFFEEHLPSQILTGHRHCPKRSQANSSQQHPQNCPSPPARIQQHV